MPKTKCDEWNFPRNDVSPLIYVTVTQRAIFGVSVIAKDELENDF